MTEFYLVTQKWPTFINETRCLVDRFLHRAHGSGYLITCVSHVVTVQQSLCSHCSIQFNSIFISIKIYTYIENTSKIAKKHVMEETTGRPIRPVYCHSLKRKEKRKYNNIQTTTQQSPTRQKTNKTCARKIDKLFII